MNGTYMKNKHSLSHNPLYLKTVFSNLGLSPIIKNAKKIISNTNEIVHIMPEDLLLAMKEVIALNNGNKANAINPMAEPAPCIFEAAVTVSFDSFTLKMPDRSPAPIAKVAITIKATIAKSTEIPRVS